MGQVLTVALVLVVQEVLAVGCSVFVISHRIPVNEAPDQADDVLERNVVVACRTFWEAQSRPL